jgi:hypothetical protein
MIISRFAFALAAAFLAGPIVTNGQETVKESSTGKSFPAVVKYVHEGTDYSMSLTGLTVRTKYIIKVKVYAMAHYAQDPGKGKTEDLLKAMTADGKAKQITMDFARDVDAEKIKEAYGDGFKENATAEELKTIQPLVDQFTGFFTKEVKENQQFILRWLPGGVITASVAGEEKPTLTNAVFARVLWSIWFGKNSIVDREELVKRIAE